MVDFRQEWLLEGMQLSASPNRCTFSRDRREEAREREREREEEETGEGNVTFRAPIGSFIRVAAARAYYCITIV